MEINPPYKSSSFLVILTLLLLPTLHQSLSPPPPQTERCHPDDKRVLLEIKSYFKNDPIFSQWHPNTDCCKKWRTVLCKKIPKTTIHRVNFLEIDGSDQLVGPIPPIVGNLPFLQTLIFRNLPNLTGPIPPVIGNLTNLRFLLLNWDNFSGPIPSLFSRLTHLVTLGLTNNRFTGPIPAYFGHLPRLQSLDLQNNQLTGRIPASLGLFPDKSFLDLSNNRLTGPIPRSLGRVNFESLDFSGNRLTGDASFLFGENKTEFAHLILARNLLSFDLTHVVMPVGVFNSSLLVLDLRQNRIYGQLPIWLGEAPSLYDFNVSHNRLCGPIPTAGGKLQTFDPLSFSYNKCLCGAPLRPCKS